MALPLPKLTADIYRVMNARLPNARDIARRIASAYQSYASTAQAPPGTPMVLTGSESVKLEKSLFLLMDRRMQGLAAANQIGHAVKTFWLIPPVASGSGGAVTAVVPEIASARMVLTNAKDAFTAAKSLAEAFDTMTRTVFVAHSPPLPSGPLF